MKIKGISDEDFLQYKKASMFIIMPYCSFKCEKDCGIKCCQNSKLATAKIIEFDKTELINRYMDNPITQAIVFGGMEPLDSFSELNDFITEFRKVSMDDIVIYTGYYESEVSDKIESLREHKNIIVKFGRFIPNSTERYDEILGITLASDNQYAVVLS